MRHNPRPDVYMVVAAYALFAIVSFPLPFRPSSTPTPTLCFKLQYEQITLFRSPGLVPSALFETTAGVRGPYLFRIDECVWAFAGPSAPSSRHRFTYGAGRKARPLVAKYGTVYAFVA